MRISALINQRIALLGLGREGLASLSVLRAAGHAETVMVLADTAPDSLPENCQFLPLSALPASNLDVVIRSPGFAPHHELRQALDQLACQQVTATQLFLNEMRAASIQVIGITASKGKSTTSALCYAALQAAGIASVLVGNIGQPALELMQEILQQRPVVVMELSSYQCADLQDGCGPQLAAIGALFPEHLDYHGSLQAYFDAKLRLAQSQTKVDSLICHAQALPQLARLDLPQAIEVVNEVVNQAQGLHFQDGVFYDGAESLFSDEGMLVPGLHNRANACLAFALARRMGVTAAQMQTALRSFAGLPFRLQNEGVQAGICWINDSISTAPEATAAALEAMQGRTYTLIAGGHERGYAPDLMVQAIFQHGVREVILLPDTGSVIASCLAEFASKHAQPPRVHQVANLALAVKLAHEVTPQGGTCIMSPGAPSYNAFSGFEARGREFRRCIHELNELSRNPSASEKL